jgi:hypothetical protein
MLPPGWSIWWIPWLEALFFAGRAGQERIFVLENILQICVSFFEIAIIFVFAKVKDKSEVNSNESPFGKGGRATTKKGRKAQKGGNTNADAARKICDCRRCGGNRNDDPGGTCRVFGKQFAYCPFLEDVYILFFVELGRFSV